MLPSMPKRQRKAEEDRHLRVIEVKLFPPTSRRYPRFDYEEIRKELGLEEVMEMEGGKEVGGKSAFHDQDAEEIVRRLEAKYGTRTVVSLPPTSKKSGKKSKKTIKFAPEDVMDKGLGYDLEDDFIDDEQAYDEWVPTTMDTAKRGHYVNKGPLEFRQIDLDATTSSSASDENNATAGEASIFDGDGDEEEPMEAEVDDGAKRATLSADTNVMKRKELPTQKNDKDKKQRRKENDETRTKGDDDVLLVEENDEIEVLPTTGCSGMILDLSASKTF
uniref:Hpc2-related domain-containing protein n=1 Tax=Globodera rostochiensis TaxID=31243 RepID=A0A914H2F0_GLORO